jgi:hypothetical protein
MLAFFLVFSYFKLIHFTSAILVESKILYWYFFQQIFFGYFQIPKKIISKYIFSLRYPKYPFLKKNKFPFIAFPKLIKFLLQSKGGFLFLYIDSKLKKRLITKTVLNRSLFLNFYSRFRFIYFFFLSFKKHLFYKKVKQLNENNLISLTLSPYLRHFELNFFISSFIVLPIPYLYFYSFLLDQTFLWKNLLIELQNWHK